MQDFLLALSSLGFSGYDMWFTRRRFLKYGISVELNPVVALLSAAGGLDFAVLIAILLPSLVLIGTGLAFHGSLFLAGYLGVRLCLFRFQRMSLKIERMVEAHNASQPPPPKGA